VQAFVKEADGRDLRLFVIDNKVVGAMERIAAEGEFRANLHLGGRAREAKISIWLRRKWRSKRLKQWALK
jgi:ribosomal protein S6--L-glutamate ligase